MKKLLHIIATPRGDESRTLQVTGAFLSALKESHPDWIVEELDVTKEALPSLTARRVDGKYTLLGGKELSGQQEEAWSGIIVQIERFLSADVYLVSAPMWNFSIPYPLKQYIDIIVQPKYLFRYTAAGIEGLVKGKKMVVITSRGGDYGPRSPAHALDLQEPYLRAIFGLVGLKDIRFINAQPMDMGIDLQKSKLEEAKREAALVTKEL